MGDPQDDGEGGHLVRGLASSTRQNSLAYGYSLALTGGFAMLAHLAGSPDVLDIFLYGAGAALTFTIASASVTRGFRVRRKEEPPVVQAVGASLGFVSVSAAIGVAALVGWAASGWVVWAVGPFAASGVYLFATGLELVAARGVRTLAGLELEQQDGGND